MKAARDQARRRRNQETTGPAVRCSSLPALGRAFLIGIVAIAVMVVVGMMLIFRAQRSFMEAQKRYSDFVVPMRAPVGE